MVQRQNPGKGLGTKLPEAEAFDNICSTKITLRHFKGGQVPTPCSCLRAPMAAVKVLCNKSSQRPHTFAKENLVWIRNPYHPDSGSSELLPKCRPNRDFLAKYICVKNSHENPILYLRRDKCQTVVMTYLSVLKNHSKKFLDLDP